MTHQTDLFRQDRPRFRVFPARARDRVRLLGEPRPPYLHESMSAELAESVALSYFRGRGVPVTIARRECEGAPWRVTQCYHKRGRVPA